MFKHIFLAVPSYFNETFLSNLLNVKQGLSVKRQTSWQKLKMHSNAAKTERTEGKSGLLTLAACGLLTFRLIIV